jgi:hypothetical protein
MARGKESQKATLSSRIEGMKQVLGLAKTGWFLGLAMVAGTVSPAGAQSEVHGRNWKPLPPTAHIEVTVVKGFNGKPLPNAAVVFHAVRDGKNDGNLEVKTNPEGKAIIDVIEVGSHVTVQVIAGGFATSATEMDVDSPSKTLEVKLIRPREQISVYQDNDGKASDLKPGMQEPPHPVKPAATPSTTLAAPSGTPKDPTQPVAVPGPLNAPPGAVTVPVQPGAPLPVVPTTTTDPATPPQTGSTQTGSPQ